MWVISGLFHLLDLERLLPLVSYHAGIIRWIRLVLFLILLPPLEHYYGRFWLGLAVLALGSDALCR
jgi:hypothetical protein